MSGVSANTAQQRHRSRSLAADCCSSGCSRPLAGVNLQACQQGQTSAQHARLVAAALAAPGAVLGVAGIQISAVALADVLDAAADLRAVLAAGRARLSAGREAASRAQAAADGRRACMQCSARGRWSSLPMAAAGRARCWKPAGLQQQPEPHLGAPFILCDIHNLDKHCRAVSQSYRNKQNKHKGGAPASRSSRPHHTAQDIQGSEGTAFVTLYTTSCSETERDLVAAAITTQ